MAMTTCGECRAQVSDKASTCPHCGAPRSANTASGGLRFFVQLLFWGWQAAMVAWLGVAAYDDVHRATAAGLSDQQAGAVLMGSFMVIGAFWVVGSVLLGLMLLAIPKRCHPAARGLATRRAFRARTGQSAPGGTTPAAARNG